MDSLTFLCILFFSIIFLQFLFKNLSKNPNFKGFVGELFVNTVLFLKLKNDYHLLKNVTLRTKDGTTQIDHIIVSIYGIFVLETKNYNGWIFGDINKKEWIQQIFKKKSYFQNPFHQNYKHIKTISENFNIHESNIKTIIIFIGDAEFKSPKVPDCLFFKVSDALKYVYSFEKPIFGDREIEFIIDLVKNNKLKNNYKNRIEHNLHVQEIIKSKNIENKKDNNEHEIVIDKEHQIR